MSAPRVEVWDPSGECPWILEGLRQEGFEVDEVALADVVLTRADVVVMAGDAEGALGALKLLRDEGLCGDVPVILLGIPEGMAHQGDGPAFGADAVLLRPVAFEPLVSCVTRLVGRGRREEDSHVGASPERASPERTMRLAGEADPASSQVFALRSAPQWHLREPTLQLRDPDGAASSAVIPRVTPAPRTGTGTGSRPGTGPIAAEVPEPLIPAEARAELSPALEALLRAADRRVFPDRPPLALHIPAANDSPAELVPAELLEAAAFRIDEPVIDDPIDAFTYVGGPAVPPAILSGGTPEPAVARDHETSPETPQRRARTLPPPPLGGRADPTLSTGAPETEWPPTDTVLGRAAPDGSRRGTLGRGGALRLLWRVATLGIDGILELACEDGPTARMTFLAGELRALDGPIATAALEALRTRGRASEAPADDAGAEAVLKRRVEDGLLGRFERDRLLREAREAILHAVLAAERASFVLRRLEDTEPGRRLFRARVLSRPLRAALVEAARTALAHEHVLALLGPRPVGLALGADREAGLASAELPAELCELLVRMEGRGLTEILAAAATEPGLSGVLYALIAGDVLVLTEALEHTEPPPEARAAVRSMIESAAALSDEGDYFAILGLRRDADDVDLERAHRARCAELVALPLALLDLASLEDRRREALETLEEARLALSDPRRRAAYARALGG